MRLNIRKQNLGRSEFEGKVFSVDPPERTVDGKIIYDFLLVLVALSEALQAWTKQDVLRDNRGLGGNRWDIYTVSKSHVLALKRQGRRLYVVASRFDVGLKTFLESVEDQADTVDELKGFLEDRTITQKIKIPPEIFASKQFFRGRHLTMGSDPLHTPPPLPIGPQHHHVSGG
ncbi:MAG: hypothetical protein V1738_00485 [Patescibacteria group bacterium]